MRRIGIFGGLDDPHVSRVVSGAMRRGHQIVQVAPEGWAGDGREPHSIVVRRDGSVSCELGLDDMLFEVDAAWVRALPVALPVIDVRAGLPAIERGVIADLLRHRFERARVVEGLVNTLVALGKTVINPPCASRALSLVLMAKAGVPVVDSMITDDADAARAFVQAGSDPRVAGSEIWKSPLTIQADAPGELVRVFIVGELVVSSVLVAEHMRAIALPAEVLSAVNEARKAVGLVFAAVDLRFGSGEFAIMNIDAAPEPMNTEISEALLDALEGEFS